MAKVAALFVQTGGIYFGNDQIDPFDIERNAMTYDGYLPVIAHPPCQLWGAMAAVNFKRWGGDHNKPGNDGGCFAKALESVVRCGGVLEHPAKSRAFDAYGLTKPNGIGWQENNFGGWVCEVWQSAYGHRANKATWLYYFGSGKPHELKWNRPKGSHQIGFQDRRGKSRNKPTLSKKESNATPEQFMMELLKLAINSRGNP